MNNGVHPDDIQTPPPHLARNETRHGLQMPQLRRGATVFKYLKVNETCPPAGRLHHHRADDAPPYP